VTENATGVLLNLTASDANGDPVTFAISGGADAGAFSLSGTALSFFGKLPILNARPTIIAITSTT
jgi:hypothetical protein